MCGGGGGVSEAERSPAWMRRGRRERRVRTSAGGHQGEGRGSEEGERLLRREEALKKGRSLCARLMDGPLLLPCHRKPACLRGYSIA